MLNNKDFIDILNRINILLLKDAQFEAREYIQLELENLKNITPQKCKFKSFNYCNKCNNINCKNKKQV